MINSSWLSLATGWTMRTVDSAGIRITHINEYQVRATIEHKTLARITPDMMCWWFNNVEGKCEYEGVSYSRFQLWHPIDHLDCKISVHPKKTGRSSNTKIRMVETVKNPDYSSLRYSLKRVVYMSQVNNQELNLIIMEFPGIETEIRHSFHSVPGGCRCITTIEVRMSSRLGKLYLQKVQRKSVQHLLINKLNLAHCVEEIGNLEFFLPGLYWAEKNKMIGSNFFFHSAYNSQKTP